MSLTIDKCFGNCGSVLQYFIRNKLRSLVPSAIPNDKVLLELVMKVLSRYIPAPEQPQTGKKSHHLTAEIISIFEQKQF